MNLTIIDYIICPNIYEYYNTQNLSHRFLLCHPGVKILTSNFQQINIHNNDFRSLHLYLVSKCQMCMCVCVTCVLVHLFKSTYYYRQYRHGVSLISKTKKINDHIIIISVHYIIEVLYKELHDHYDMGI